MAKHRTTITELNQLDHAYGRNLTWKRQMKIAIKPAIITALFSFVLLGVVGLTPKEQGAIVQKTPEFSYFQQIDSEDAQTYLQNIKSGKNKTYWEADMPSLKADPDDPKPQNYTHERAEAYDAMTAAVKKKSMIPNAIKMALSLWREAVFFLIGLLYGWLYVLPRQIKLEYNMNALTQRNSAINLLTQAFADTTQPPVFALQVARDNTKGKLKDDFRLLSSVVAKRESDESIMNAIRDLRHEYADDMVFDLYMEQVATYLIKGDISQETFNNLMRQHNAILGETQIFQQHKTARVKKLTGLMYMTFGVGVFVAGVVMNILGPSLFMSKVWGSLVGFGGAVVVAGGTLWIYSMMMKNYFDNDLMSM